MFAPAGSTTPQEEWRWHLEYGSREVSGLSAPCSVSPALGSEPSASTIVEDVRIQGIDRGPGEAGGHGGLESMFADLCREIEELPPAEERP